MSFRSNRVHPAPYASHNAFQEDEGTADEADPFADAFPPSSTPRLPSGHATIDDDDEVVNETWFELDDDELPQSHQQLSLESYVQTPIVALKNRLEREKARALHQQRSALQEQFNILLHDQHLQFEGAREKLLDHSRSVLLKEREQSKAHRGKLIEKCEELWNRLKSKSELCGTLTERLTAQKEQVSTLQEKLRRERMKFQAGQAAAVGADDLAIQMEGGGGLDEETSMVVFGSEWFEDLEDYDDMHVMNALQEQQQEGGARRAGGASKVNDTGLTQHQHAPKWFGCCCEMNPGMTKCMKRLSFLSHDVEMLEARFGSAIGTYFRMFRTQVLINLLVALLIALAFIPHLTFLFLDDDHGILTDPWMLIPNRTESVVVPTFLSFRAYLKSSDYTRAFNMVFFAMFVLPFLVFTLTLFVEMASEFRHKTALEVKARDVENKQFLALVLNLWDYRVTDRKDVMNRRYEILGDLKVLLHQKAKEEEILLRSRSTKTGLLIRKIIGNALLVVIVVLSWTFLILLNVYKEWISTQLSEILPFSISVGSYLVPVAISLINFFAPKFSVWITDFERWDKNEVRIKIVFFRLYALKIVTVILLCVQYVRELTPTATNPDDCLIKTVGDEVFLVMVFGFVGEFLGLIPPLLYFIIKRTKNVILNRREKKRMEELKRQQKLKRMRRRRQRRRKMLRERRLQAEKGRGGDVGDSEDAIDDGSGPMSSPLPDGDHVDGIYDEEEDEERSREGGEIDTEIEEEEHHVEEEDEDESGRDLNEADLEYETAKLAARRGPEKQEFETHKKLISLLYSQVLVWICLPFFPVGVAAGGAFSLIVFKFQRYLLQMLQTKEKTPVAARKLGAFFVLFYFISYMLPLALYYYVSCMFVMTTNCGFGMTGDTSAQVTLLASWKDLFSYYITALSLTIWDHVFTNPLLLYLVCGLILVLFIGRRDKIRSLMTYLNGQRMRMKKETAMYEHRIRQNQGEIDQWKKKADKLHEAVKQYRHQH